MVKRTAHPHRGPTCTVSHILATCSCMSLEPHATAHLRLYIYSVSGTAWTMPCRCHVRPTRCACVPYDSSSDPCSDPVPTAASAVPRAKVNPQSQQSGAGSRALHARWWGCRVWKAVERRQTATPHRTGPAPTGRASPRPDVSSSLASGVRQAATQLEGHGSGGSVRLLPQHPVACVSPPPPPQRAWQARPRASQRVWPPERHVSSERARVVTCSSGIITAPSPAISPAPLTRTKQSRGTCGGSTTVSKTEEPRTSAEALAKESRHTSGLPELWEIQSNRQLLLREWRLCGGARV